MKRCENIRALDKVGLGAYLSSGVIIKQIRMLLLSLYTALVKVGYNIDADTQRRINIKDIALMQATSFDLDLDTDTRIRLISIPASASMSESGSIL